MKLISVDVSGGRTIAVIRARVWWKLWLGLVTRTLERDNTDGSNWYFRDTGAWLQGAELRRCLTRLVNSFQAEQKRLEKLLNEAEPGTLVPIHPEHGWRAIPERCPHCRKYISGLRAKDPEQAAIDRQRDELIARYGDKIRN
jgi:hypothetical protein